MNAYELAEIVDKWAYSESAEYLTDAANMLRQQADRIAELEKQGEPVAWMEYIQDEEWEVWYIEPTNLPEGHSYKPLYLAPQTKPLSDEEIKEVWIKRPANTAEDVIKFARAIEERHGIK